jgi:S1-C subfamily serine protease
LQSKKGIDPTTDFYGASQSMFVTSNILFRIVRIQTPHQVGSGTIIELDDREFILTAAHVMEGVGPSSLINIQGNEWSVTWKIISKHVRGDACLVAFGGKFNRNTFEMKYGSKNSILSMDAFVMGFPEGRVNYLDVKSESGQRRMIFPFLRKGIISAVLRQEFIVDCIIQKGFSGGPLFIMDGPNKLVPRILGVISSGLTFSGDDYANDRRATTIRSGFTSCVSMDLVLELAEDEFGMDAKALGA